MVFTEVLSTDDLDEIGRLEYGAEDRLAVAADLVDAVDRGGLADKADAGYALDLASEILERNGDLTGALDLAERAVEAYALYGDPEYGFPRAWRASLLLRLGRQDEGMAELVALRPRLATDPDAVSYVVTALEASGQAETAEAWLTAALDEVLSRWNEPDAGLAQPLRAAVVFTLARRRHDVRRALDLPHDRRDELADRLDDAIVDAWDDGWGEDDADVALFWPRPEHEELVRRWPELAEEYGETWDEHREDLERMLADWSASGETHLRVVVGLADGLADYAAGEGAALTDGAVLDGYTDELGESAAGIAWPPGRNAPCWCGSGVKYKKCCLPRSRT
ncbi:MAG TPA: SEC-C domain-containing protein [Mycobacteriales bacterium]|nr:SEC-C domain-containing protein [Mycobacteriales bacterium]